MRDLIFVAFWASVASACAEDLGRGIDRFIELKGPALVPAAVLAERVETLHDTLPMHMTTDLAVIGDQLVVADAGNDRLVFFDGTLTPTKVVGHSGSGPGELEMPMLVQVVGDRLAVFELSNRRISFFDRGGSFQGVLGMPVAYGDISMLDEGSMLSAHGTPRHYLTLVDPSGTGTPFAAIPRVLHEQRDAFREEHGDAWQDLVAVTRDRRVHVFDNALGILHTYGDGGELLWSARLPRDVVRAAARANERTRRRWERVGRKVLGAALARRLATVEGSRLLLLLGEPDPFALLIDPTTMTARCLRYAEEDERWSFLSRGTAAELRGAELVILHAVGVARVRLEEEGDE